jgi:hypothetical protein
VTLSADAVKRIPSWGRPDGKSQAGEIAQIRLRNVKLEVKPALDPFDATLVFTREGTLRQATLRGAGGSWNLVARPAEKGFNFDFGASNWTLPMGAAIPVSEATLRGTFDATHIVVPEFSGHAFDGTVNGTLQLDWTSGFRLQSDLSVARLDAKELMHTFTPDIALTGRVDGNFNVAAESQGLETLLAAPRVQGRFKLAEGSVSNVDLVAVMQSDEAGQRAGVTKFAELTGEYASGDHRIAYRQLLLQGGVLRGNGSVELGQTGSLAGHLALEIRSQVAQDRGSFVVSGTVARPIIKRGG